MDKDDLAFLVMLALAMLTLLIAVAGLVLAALALR